MLRHTGVETETKIKRTIAAKQKKNPERAGEGIFEFIDDLLDAGEVEVDARSEK